MSILMCALLRYKYQNEVVAGNNGRGKPPIKERWSRKDEEAYLESLQAHPHSYWTRETMLEAIGKFLENNGGEASEAEEYFGELSDKELMMYFEFVSDRHQPRGASTPDDELLICPSDRMIFERTFEQRRLKRRAQRFQK